MESIRGTITEHPGRRIPNEVLADFTYVGGWPVTWDCNKCGKSVGTAYLALHQSRHPATGFTGVAEHARTYDQGQQHPEFGEHAGGVAL